MAGDSGSQEVLSFEMLAIVKAMAKSVNKCHMQLLQYEVLRTKDEQLHLNKEVIEIRDKITELKEAGQDATELLARVTEVGGELKRVTSRLTREARKSPVSFDDIKPFIDEFMDETKDLMKLMLWHQEGEGTQPIANLPTTPDADEDDDNYHDAPVSLENYSPAFSPHPPLQSPPSSKRTSPENSEPPPSPKRRAYCRDITTAEIGKGFTKQKVTETPAGSGEWYVFQCQEHDLPLDGLARPAQAAARHSIAHGLQPTRASAIEAFGIRVIGCDATFAKLHNDQVVTQPKRKAGSQVNNTTVDHAYRHRHGRGNDKEMSQLLSDINPSHPRHIPQRRVVETRKRTILSRDPDGTEKPAEITAKTIYWIKWPDDGLCYPACVLPWESYPRFRSKYLVPVDRGLLESVDELPACYDKGHGFAGVWAEGYKDGQRKMSKRVYPVIFFTLGKRFPWECETGWAAAEDFRVFDGDKEDPQYKALVDHWLARKDRQTPDDELIKMKLMSPPLDRGSSSSSNSDWELSPEESPEGEDIDKELREAFEDLNECLSSDRGSSREESPESENDDGDIGNALLRGASESHLRHTSIYRSQHMPQCKDTQTHDQRRSKSRALRDGTTAGRRNPDEDEESDIYDDDNVGPFPDQSPSKVSDCEYRSRSSSSETFSRQRVETSEGDVDVRFAEPRGRAGSASRRIAHAMAHASRQANSFLNALLEEADEETDELSS
ncbi:hypothetical protein FGADI_10103 [Fusarium gaditjirri]|uniref:Uncharacterized protein n=1 Tax=Fusarium gaditjirri TaxID=282569 RepID=A0A8H4WS42_9HYPO|nr:hypothetical protein FGADI_10103 [Fusarium gaditjirri]